MGEIPRVAVDLPCGRRSGQTQRMAFVRCAPREIDREREREREREGEIKREREKERERERVRV